MKYSDEQRTQIKQLASEAQLLLLSSSEGLQYIRERLGLRTGKTITEDYYYMILRQLEDERGEKLIYLGGSKTAYAAAHMERIEQVRNVGKEAWRLFYLNEGRTPLQSALLGRILEVITLLTELENIIPNIMDLPQPQPQPQHEDMELQGQGEQPSVTYFQEEMIRAAKVPTPPPTEIEEEL